MSDEPKENGASAPQKQGLKAAWKPGQSGNPAGRRKGSRNKLSESFISALCEDFEANGVSVIEAVRAEKPADYLKIIASIVPKELTVRDGTLEDLSDEELLERLDQVQSVAAALIGAKAQSGTRPKAGKKAPTTSH